MLVRLGPALGQEAVLAIGMVDAQARLRAVQHVDFGCDTHGLGGALPAKVVVAFGRADMHVPARRTAGPASGHGTGVGQGDLSAGRRVAPNNLLQQTVNFTSERAGTFHQETLTWHPLNTT